MQPFVREARSLRLDRRADHREAIAVMSHFARTRDESLGGW